IELIVAYGLNNSSCSKVTSERQVVESTFEQHLLCSQRQGEIHGSAESRRKPTTRIIFGINAIKPTQKIHYSKNQKKLNIIKNLPGKF
ncbi:hypothetical protein, partial [Yersinia pseudotuberculosis]|uniref:hypothetical protein n=1 Tax=Yersinia pseudotuberculosis TaxID=633 RepID=UPI0020012AFD